MAVGDLGLADGALITLGGGELDDKSFVETLVGPLPEQCPAERYWLATNVELGFNIPD